MPFNRDSAREAGKKSKRKPLVPYFREQIEKDSETLYNEILKLAREGGNIGAYKLLFEYGIGKPRQLLEVDSYDSIKNIEIKFVKSNAEKKP